VLYWFPVLINCMQVFSFHRRVWRYKRCNQNPTTHWPKEKGQKDKQRSTNYYI